jgi:thymidylate synthase
MHLTCPNVNFAFHTVVEGIAAKSIPTVERESRYGPVLQIPEPVIITYTHPREKVLTCPGRDANPFFHLYEAIWMLAGRRDVAPLAYYNSRMPEFSDDGHSFHGAYGYRWRHWFGYDQLGGIVNELTKDPDSRRCVLQMWDATVEPPHASTEWSDPYMASENGKDVPCNTQAYFLLRKSPDYDLAYGTYHPQVLSGDVKPGARMGCMYLDMTVCNRSNDIIWGMLGANAVHFAFLQEWMAARLGVEVGHYHQISNNAHVYTERFKPQKWLTNWDYESYSGESVLLDAGVHSLRHFSTAHGNPADTWDHRGLHRVFPSDFLEGTAKQMCLAYWAYRTDRDPWGYINRIAGADWRFAASMWLRKRER